MSGGLIRDRGLEGNFWQERSLTAIEWDRENFGTCLETATTCDVIKGKKKSATRTKEVGGEVL